MEEKLVGKHFSISLSPFFPTIRVSCHQMKLKNKGCEQFTVLSAVGYIIITDFNEC